jgi:putative ABC transport system permease protein
VYPRLWGLGIAISVLFAVAGTAKGVWKVLRLHPAEAMRPRPPERGSAMFLERFGGLWRRLSFRTHIALRSLARNPGRTATGVIACTLAGAIIMTGLIMRDSVWFMVDFQFDYVAHSDVDVGLRDERSLEALAEAQALPGVDYAEPVLGLVCDVRHGTQARRMSVTGLWPGRRLLTPMREDLRAIAIPEDGVVLSRKLAEILGAGVGDRLELRPVRGRRETVAVPVRSVVDSFLGLDCYADLRYLSGLVGEYEAMNSVQMLVDPSRRNELYAALKQLPNIQSVSVRANARANIQDTLVRSLNFSLSILIGFAGVIALGSMLNAALIEIADRTRDIATFRVLGYDAGAIAGIFLRQAGILLVVGLVLAMPVAYVLVHLLALAYNTELFRLPVLIRPGTVLMSCAVMAVFAAVSQFVVYRQVRGLDWLEGIKIKE